jgi:hypothetical protein
MDAALGIRDRSGLKGLDSTWRCTMNGFPIQAIVVSVLGIAFVLFYVLVLRKKQVASLDQSNAGYRAGALAERLGLTLVSGDPGFNLFIPQADAGVLSGPKDEKPVHVEILMQGEKNGVPLELRYFYRKEQKTDNIKGVIKWTTWFECAMSAQAKQAFPEFEVTSRSTSTGPITRTLALPEAKTGNASVDSTYLVTTKEQGMAKLMADHMGAFAQYTTGGVHLIGDGKTVSFPMERDKSVLVGYGLYFAESMAENLVAIARAVGG